MKFTDGLFLEVARRVAAEYPQVAFDDRIIDALCMQLVQAPERVRRAGLPNFYGDVVSDVAAGLIGGLGVAPGGPVGETAAVFEATHGTAPRLAGRNRANPVGVTLSAAMMLRHIGETDAGDRLEAAVAAVLAEGSHLTDDLRLARRRSATRDDARGRRCDHRGAVGLITVRRRRPQTRARRPDASCTSNVEPAAAHQSGDVSTNSVRRYRKVHGNVAAVLAARVPDAHARRGTHP